MRDLLWGFSRVTMEVEKSQDLLQSASWKLRKVSHINSVWFWRPENQGKGWSKPQPKGRKKLMSAQAAQVGNEEEKRGEFSFPLILFYSGPQGIFVLIRTFHTHLEGHFTESTNSNANLTRTTLIDTPWNKF